MAEVGATAQENSAVRGHKTPASVQRYSEAAGREGVRDSVIEKPVVRPNDARNLANLTKRFVKTETKPEPGNDNS